MLHVQDLNEKLDEKLLPFAQSLHLLKQSIPCYGSLDVNPSQACKTENSRIYHQVTELLRYPRMADLTIEEFADSTPLPEICHYKSFEFQWKGKIESDSYPRLVEYLRGSGFIAFDVSSGVNL